MPADYPEREYIIDGVKHGFHLINSDVNKTSFVEVNNYKSATEPLNKQFVEKQIVDEIRNGHYKIVQKKPNIISALGAIPKNSECTKFRLIHDASRPYGSALNDLARHDPFRYQSLQDAVDMISPGYYIGKVDLASAYRSVGIHPSNYDATGIKWLFQGDKDYTYMVDTRMCFGGRRSPEIFNKLSQSVRAIMASHGYSGIVAYADDFLIVSEDAEQCRQPTLALVRILRRLGFSINYNKVHGPSQILTFLGIELDTIDMTLALPQEKMDDIRKILQRRVSQRKCTKRELQSIIGKLNWATQVIYGGRFHLRRLLDAMVLLRYPSHRTRITQAMRADMEWWLQFMSAFNGLTGMVSTRPAAPVTIDASTHAAGAHYLGQAIYTPWGQCWPLAAPLHINHKEVLALETAVSAWAPQWRNKKIFVHCDNQCAVYTINKGISKHPLVMDSLRRVFWWSALFNFRIKAVYYPGQYNIIADRVSRLNERDGLAKFKTACSQAFLW